MMKENTLSRSGHSPQSKNKTGRLNNSPVGQLRKKQPNYGASSVIKVA
jgi:hypothetical protein